MAITGPKLLQRIMCGLVVFALMLLLTYGSVALSEQQHQAHQEEERHLNDVSYRRRLDEINCISGVNCTEEEEVVFTVAAPSMKSLNVTTIANELLQPSNTPSTFLPTNQPSQFMFAYPSATPSTREQSTTVPSLRPSTAGPSRIYSPAPTNHPESQPVTIEKYNIPSIITSGSMESNETSLEVVPSISNILVPSSIPDATPLSELPSQVPSKQPNMAWSNHPSPAPSESISSITFNPSTNKLNHNVPSKLPSTLLSSRPSIQHSEHPSEFPTHSPNVLPSSNPSVYDQSLTAAPSSAPSLEEEIVYVSREDICPQNRVFHTPKVFIEPRNITGTDIPLLNEISALAISSQRVPDAPDHILAWVAQDGPINSFSAVDLTTGATVAVVHVDNIVVAPEDDWEAIALGPCSSTSIVGVDRDCLYLGNVGNNDAMFCEDCNCTLGRDTLYIYKLEEPQLTSLDMGDLNRSVSILPINFQSDSFPVNQYNIEALFVDWTGIGGDSGGSSSSSSSKDDDDDDDDDQRGDLYLIPKQSIRGKYIRIAKVPVLAHEKLIAPTVATPYTCQAMDRPSWQSKSISDAEMTRDGRLIALRDVNQIRYFARETGKSISNALHKSKNHCKYASRNSKNLLEDENRFEAVSFVPSSSSSSSRSRNAFVRTRSVVELSECYQRRSCRVPIFQFSIASDYGLDDIQQISISSISPRSDSSKIIADPHQSWQWNIITRDTAEDGMGNFQVGGTGDDEEGLYEDDYYGRSPSYRLRDNDGLKDGGTSSMFHSNDHDVTYYNELRVSFNFVMDGYRDNENFFLECSSDGGMTYSIIKEYVRQAKGMKNVPNTYKEMTSYHESVIIRPNQVPFTTRTRLRFRSNARQKKGHVYIDDITFEGMGPIQHFLINFSCRGPGIPF